MRGRGSLWSLKSVGVLLPTMHHPDICFGYQTMTFFSIYFVQSITMAVRKDSWGFALFSLLHCPFSPIRAFSDNIHYRRYETCGATMRIDDLAHCHPLIDFCLFWSHLEATEPRLRTARLEPSILYYFISIESARISGSRGSICTTLLSAIIITALSTATRT